MNNGVMTMRPVKGGLSIPPGQSVTLAPGGYHIMLMELKAPLKKGDKVPVTLAFEKAGEVNVTLDVQGIGATGPTSDAGHATADENEFRPQDVSLTALAAHVWYWHLADNPTSPAFVRYWSNSGQVTSVGLDRLGRE
jgi:hypothetical protein